LESCVIRRVRTLSTIGLHSSDTRARFSSTFHYSYHDYDDYDCDYDDYDDYDDHDDYDDYDGYDGYEVTMVTMIMITMIIMIIIMIVIMTIVIIIVIVINFASVVLVGSFNFPPSLVQQDSFSRHLIWPTEKNPCGKFCEVITILINMLMPVN
jgi:hypothetical protein